MDQLKVVLQGIKKHHFWVLCGVIVVVVLAVWWSATSGLAGRIDERKKDLEGKMTNVRNIASQPLHENQEVLTGIQGSQKDTTAGVEKAWDFLYKRQTNVMKWPDLGYGFRDYMELLPPDAEIPDRFRDLYMNFIQGHFPTLYEIVDIRLPAQLDEQAKPILDENGKVKKVDPFESALGGAGYSGPGEGMPMPSARYPGAGYEGPGMRTTGQGNLVGLVHWNLADLRRIRDRLYWTNRPATIQVRLAQENLWVYEALLRVIAATNEGATNYYNAAVKQISALEIGQTAAAAFARASGQSFRTGGPMAMGGDEYDYEGSGMSGEYMSGSYMGSMEMDEEGGGVTPGYPMGRTGMTGAMTGASAEERLKASLLAYRYVDQDHKPLREPTSGEFKRMPVRMLLLVDQRRITRLLAECANSGMPVEVTKVALNPGMGSLDFARMTTAGRVGYEEEGSGMMPYPGGMPMGGMPMGGTPMMPGSEYEEEGPAYMGAGGTGPTQRREQQTSYDVPIEIQGIIYIFDRPDSEKLGAGTAAAAAAAASPASGGVAP